MIKQSISAINHKANIHKQSNRTFFSIKKIIPDTTKKAYAYLTKADVKDKTLNYFYKKTESIVKNDTLSPAQTQEALLKENFLLNHLTNELARKNPEFTINKLGVFVRPQEVSVLHDDTNIDADLIFILPIAPNQPQTLFFEDFNIFERTNEAENFYAVKPLISFKDYATDAAQAVPKDAIGSIFSPIGTDGNPLVHSAPFDTTDDRSVLMMAKTGRTINNLHSDTPLKNRGLFVWTIKKKDTSF